MKLYSKLLNVGSGALWEDFLMVDVLGRGSCDVFNLCSLGFGRRVPDADPLFHEAAEAWVQILLALRCKVRSKGEVLGQPLFGNLELGDRRVLPAGVAGLCAYLQRVGDVVDERGSVDEAVVVARVRRRGMQVDKRRVVRLCRSVIADLPGEWWECLCGEGETAAGRDGVGIVFVCGDMDFVTLKVRFWYRWLRECTLKKPTAEEG